MWKPEKTMPLPPLEWLLTLADHAHNLTGHRGYGTFAVGAVGEDATEVELVLGVESSQFDDVKIFAEKKVPPVVRNAVEMSNVVMTQDAYHAEVSCVLWAKENKKRLLAIASSRTVCAICAPFLTRHFPDASVADNWVDPTGKHLTHQQREGVSLGSRWTNGLNSTGFKAVYRSTP